ncbi:MAG TPA: hypothetical protein VHZ30_00430, partial [Verrucomicrobiae bacterium]|nr:hypothetical protein [Verrucomicrobiae bacterium]
LRRFSSFESDHNRQARVRGSWLAAFEDMGFTPQFISSEEIEAGRLRSATNAALVLPSSYALSDREASEITAFAKHSKNGEIARTIFCDGVPGVFDEHGKLRGQTALKKLFPTAVAPTAISSSGGLGMFATGPGDISSYVSERLKSTSTSDIPQWLRKQLGSLKPEIFVPSSARVRIHRFRAGRAELVAFERNVDYQMSEDLKQAGGNEALEKPVEIEAVLPRAEHIFDLRGEKYLGHSDHLHFTLDPWKPSLFAITGEKLPADTIIATLAREMETAK